MTRLQQLLDVEIPIIQAPMTFIARAPLAAAVSEAGGLGIVETLSPEGRADLLRMRELTAKPFGANLMIQGWKKDPSIVDVLAEARVPVVTTSAGDPALFTDRLHDAGITVLHVVGSLRAAQKAADAGVDGLVVEGVEGGGFKSAGGASTLVLLPLVCGAVDLPVVAAGGLCDAASVAAAFVLGAEGAQLGTRMLATEEAGVHPAFKQAITAAGDDATVLLSVPGNPTMRVLRNNFGAQVLAGEREGRLLDGIHELYFGGDMEASVANTGQVAARIDDVVPVAELVRGIWDGVQGALDAGRSRLG
ncbi:NAD(P)H-dependent flavin oxidoreductase [Nocardioides sp.]|uniref:NAD(P)H-dependent flavin oxidoreductase n=1 Tax=Nocardioides sp. TaxID=35761 RepID=UPI0035162F43